MTIGRLILRLRRPGMVERLAYLILSYLGLALFFTLAMAPRIGVGGAPGLDKVLHFGGFAVVAGFAGLSSDRRLQIIAHGLIFVAAGVMIEIAQHVFVATRTGSWLDALANAAGVAAGFAAARVFIVHD